MQMNVLYLLVNPELPVFSPSSPDISSNPISSLFPPKSNQISLFPSHFASKFNLCTFRQKSKILFGHQIPGTANLSTKTIRQNLHFPDIFWSYFSLFIQFPHQISPNFQLSPQNKVDFPPHHLYYYFPPLFPFCLSFTFALQILSFYFLPKIAQLHFYFSLEENLFWPKIKN